MTAVNRRADEPATLMTKVIDVDPLSPEARLATELIFGRPPDEVDEPAMGRIQLRSHRGQ